VPRSSLPFALPAHPVPGASPPREASARRAALVIRQAERDHASAPTAAKVTWAPTPSVAPRRTRSGADNGSTVSGVDGGPAPSSGKRPADTAASCGTPTQHPAPSPAKRPRPPASSNASDDAVILGYELGTIKHSAYVLLHRAGLGGLTVSTIVETATREGLYSWGTCKTPNNSVTAALSQDGNFQRVAPSTYALRDVLRPVGQAALREAVAARNAAAAAAAAAGGEGAGVAAAAVPRPRSSGARPAKRSGARPGGDSRSRGSAGEPSRSLGSLDSAQLDGAARPTHGRGEVHSHVSGAPPRPPRGAPPPIAEEGGHHHGSEPEREGSSFVYAPACYPPPSPPTPEEEKRGVNGRDTSGAMLLAYGSPARGAAAGAGRCPAPSEAHARAVRWRHEAADARPHAHAAEAAAARAAAAAEAALAANSLPSWVVQSYLAEKAACAASCGGSEGDASAAGLPTPPQQTSAMPVCAC
jgi:hypothetical protein